MVLNNIGPPTYSWKYTKMLLQVLYFDHFIIFYLLFPSDP